MMYGRGLNGRGFGEGNGCFGNGFMNSGWHILILLAIVATIVVITYLLVHNRNKKSASAAVLELLKMKYVQGEITEEEYLKRKEVLDKHK